MDPLEPWVANVRPDDGRLLAKLTQVYADSFPDSERKPVAFLEGAAKRDDYALLALICRDDPVGLAVVYRSPSATLALLEYMAVSAGRRGRGLGAALFKAVAESNRDRTLLLEVEAGDAGESGSSPSRRRKAFYKRLGCRELLGIAYRMPQVATEVPPPMSLMACGAKGGTLDRSMVRIWLVEIFRRVYAVPDPEGPVDAMLAKSPERIRLV